jgi:hypothetical protein
MKYALINGQRHEAQPGLTGTCQVNGCPMISKCGEIKVWHWSHRGKRKCDPWWENETEWHRFWKNKFPEEWQEVVHKSENNEKHVADVKTAQGWVLEFQHSHLQPEERRARDNFYPKLVWIVDGIRRKRDKSQFHKLFDDALLINIKPWLYRVFIEESTLLKEWSTCRAPVIFDFGNNNNPEILSHLWCLIPNKDNTWAYITPFNREGFIALHRANTQEVKEDFAQVIMTFGKIITHYLSRQRSQRLNQFVLKPRYRRAKSRRL